VEDKEAAKRGAKLLREKLGVHVVQVHLKGSAAAASATEAVAVPGYYTQRPVITTGGGDHFNGGFLSAMLNGCTLADCLRVVI
jgi:sugar/nucleoside kinase (ribokinase family)